MKTFISDVLVIGAGGAGLSAAVAAGQQGRSVVVVSKDGPGRAASTTVSQANFRISGNGYTKEKHLRLTLETGLGLSEKSLVEELTDKGENDVWAMQDMGVPLKSKYASVYCEGKLPFARGAAIVLPLAAYAARRGVRFIQPCLVCELLINKGAAAGAWGLFKNSGEPVLFMARSVVLATGGAGALYERRDTPSALTGDGYALAARTGASLVDMEFVQFYPLVTAYRRGRSEVFIPPMTAEIAPLVNRAGIDLVKKHGLVRPIAVRSRDLTCRAIVDEGLAWLDFSGVTAEDWENNKGAFDPAEASQLKEWLHNNLLSRGKLVPVLPAAHFNMGGVKINAAAETDIPGLFAAGEAAGGLHGANRLGGNALTETVVFGKKAGQGAAAYMGNAISEDKAALQVKTALAEIKAAYMDKQGPALSEARAELTKLMWEKVGIIRDRAALTDALREINQLNSQAFNCAESEIPKLLEFKNMLLAAELICRSALFREESRGSHYRSDFPAQDDDNWRCHTGIRLEGEKSIIAKVDVQ